ncbi:MAG: hypothetical protein PWP49_1119 [Thermococcaceae archaeon]|jgi:aspartate/methionine/tyrosine aminotransferase|nr:hypothetical protein [Thermococcaceae archaeon]MDN5320699.1 hypothetical protein [Thermococcaceae archaeon]
MPIKISCRTNRTPYPIIREVLNEASRLSNVIHLEIGDFAESSPKELDKYIDLSLKEGYTHYTDNAGIIELRKVIAEYYKVKYGVDITEENVVVTVGGMEGLFLALLLTTDPNDSILLPNPGYPNYFSMASLLDLVPRYYILKEENGFLSVPEEIERLITPNTRAIILNSPNNPTGAVYPRKTLKAIAEIAEDNNLVVISDEVYENIIFDGKRHTTMLEFDNIKDNLIVVNSFSKSFMMTGWRLGFIILPEDLLDMARKLQENIVACPPAMIQKAGVYVLEELYPTFVRKLRDKLQNKRDFIVSVLKDVPDISFVTPQGAFYLFLNVSRYTNDSYKFSKQLLMKKGVATAPGISFGENGEGYVRISFSPPKDVLSKGIERLIEFLKEPGGSKYGN